MRMPKIPPPIPLEEKLEHKLSEHSREVHADTIRHMREAEMRAPETMRAKLRELRERREAMNKETRELFAEMQDRMSSGQKFDPIELVHERLDKLHSSEEQESGQQRLAQHRAAKRETEALRTIRCGCGDDIQKLIAASRNYAATHPDHHRGYTFLADALLKSGDNAGGVAAYREAVRLAGEHSAAGLIVRARLGDALAKAGDLDGAISELERVIGEATVPVQVSTASYYLGNILNRAGMMRPRKPGNRPCCIQCPTLQQTP